MKVSGGPADALCAPPRTHAARLVLRVCGWDLGTGDRSLLATLICGELCFNTLRSPRETLPDNVFPTTRANLRSAIVDLKMYIRMYVRTAGHTNTFHVILITFLARKIVKKNRYIYVILFGSLFPRTFNIFSIFLRYLLQQ